LSDFSVRPADPLGAPAQGLIARHLSLMHEQTPPESVHAMGAAELAGPDVDFFLLWDGDTPLAMGALKRWGDRQGELKSMHVLAEARGRGVGAALLDHLLAHARTLGLVRLSLETGADEYFIVARRLYARYGFQPCPPFADYVPDPLSAFMRLDLAP
tara:strand:- start:1711 stop:2181 length:471 start_codon:yes stop_codon:yes gene_type:complete